MAFEPGVLQAHAATLQQRCAAIEVGDRHANPALGTLLPAQ